MRFLTSFFLVVVMVFTASSVFAAPSKKYWARWVAFNPVSEEKIDYSSWNSFLSKYYTEEGGQSYIKYAQVTKSDEKTLNDAIDQLTKVNIDDYKRSQQMAYWINLYNMKMVSIILNHYPVPSIRHIESGIFSLGPWGKKYLTVEGVPLSLNDIEHRILRPIWNDPRIHAALNCASISCPNLHGAAYEGDFIDDQLNDAFRSFVESKKGVAIIEGKIYLSKIFDWYREDFGDSEQLRKFIASYLNDEDKKKMVLKGVLGYQKYNWALNKSMN